MDNWEDPNFELRNLRVIDLKKILHESGVSFPVNARKIEYIRMVDRIRKNKLSSGPQHLLSHLQKEENSNTSKASSSEDEIAPKYLYPSSPSKSTKKPHNETEPLLSPQFIDKPSNIETPVKIESPHVSQNNTFQSYSELSPNVETSLTMKTPPAHASTPKFRSHKSHRVAVPMSFMDSSALHTSPAFSERLKLLSSSNNFSPQLRSPKISHRLQTSATSSPLQHKRPFTNVPERVSRDIEFAPLDSARPSESSSPYSEVDSAEEDDELFQNYVLQQTRKESKLWSFIKKVFHDIKYANYRLLHNLRAFPGISAISSSYLVHIFMILLGVVAAIFLALLREKMFTAGFCDSGASGSSASILGISFPSLCRTCPPNAICPSPNYVECKPGYVLYEPWYSSLGFWPSKYCVSDTSREESVNIFREECLSVLRSWNAILHCSNNSSDLLERNMSYNAHPYVADNLNISSDHISFPSKPFALGLLHDTLLERKSPTLGLEMFEDLFKASLAVLSETNEVVMDSKLICYDSWAGIPLRCRLKQQLIKFVWRNKVFLFGILALSGVIFKLINFFRTRSIVAKYLPSASRFCVESLKRQKANYQMSRSQEPVIPLIEMHDILFHGNGPLEQIHMTKATARTLWEAIVERVEQVGSVRTRESEVDGEWTRVWEWVGTNTLDFQTDRSFINTTSPLRE
ncbi:LEM domain nuclear inner membrane protein Heh1/Lem2 [Schizosaccharomyces pombe]|uniref:Lap-Emerin-Man domain protein 2 n=1 Tax=Schizosaccharomyces pombe (strain 972 / ATCC 24843) TaxID=284812 RepID=LEM2_SCHPO|nr:LEM domain protein Heh1/Lem2 [Schizosaccharomyces pombe]Q10109.1 RecName: Full=Lap-Emerin-Man domain protein 2; Short=LEM domain protein 2 [Schizosaccharomyces pombe 972h-]CAA92388.1 LEM domain protein Heh1/Lem2 [Schizosaccharomyces pombe]|eukprot:NP_593673.1 LEM domain protein Heh1/Lem2 [Schizosaccharomyces pombe]